MYSLMLSDISEMCHIISAKQLISTTVYAGLLYKEYHPIPYDEFICILNLYGFKFHKSIDNNKKIILFRDIHIPFSELKQILEDYYGSQ